MGCILTVGCYYRQAPRTQDFWAPMNLVPPPALRGDSDPGDRSPVPPPHALCSGLLLGVKMSMFTHKSK